MYFVAIMNSTENKTQRDSSKISPFDELSREELITKCKGLLAIAQKSKQSKQEILKEYAEIRIKIEEYEKKKKNRDENLRTLQELNNSLTEQKLNYITELESAQNKIKYLNQKCVCYEDAIKNFQDEIIIRDKNNADTLLKLSNLDSENISIKRQKKRLEKENEQLLTQLSELEARIEEVNNLGLQQGELLKILEEKIQSEEKYKTLIEELNKKNTALKHNLQTNKGANENKCPNQLASYENSIKEITQLYETEQVNHEKCNIKLRSYRDKISKCAASIKQLKNSRFILSKTVKEYSETIPKWRNDIIAASVVLDGQIKELREENMNLKEKITNLDEQIKRYSVDTDLLRNEIADLQSRNNDLSDINCQLTKDIESLRDNTQLNIIAQCQEAEDAKVLKDQLYEITDKHDALLKKYSDIQKELQTVCAENIHLNELSQNTSAENKKIECLELQIKALESEKSILVKEKLNAKDHAVELDDKNHTLLNHVNKMKSDVKKLNLKLNELENENSILKNTNKSETDDKVNKLKCQIAFLQEQCDLLKKENESMADINGLLKEEVETLKLSLEQPKDEFDNMSELNVSLQADIVRLDTKLLAYKQENSSLLTEVKELRSKIKEDDNLFSELEIAKIKLSAYKTKNVELLREMKEINQVLKERGECISKLQKAVAEMEILIHTLDKDMDASNEEKEDLRKSISVLEDQLTNAKIQASHSNDTTQKLLSENEINIKSLTDKDVIISSLKDAIEKLKQQQQSCSVDFNNEDMSTSTISKAEEHARMRDLDETFEEKYTKLRIFALKLKKKLNETTTQLQNSEKDKERLSKLLADTKTTPAASTDEVDQGPKDDSSQELISDLETKVEALAATVASTESIGKELEALKVEVTNLNQKLSAEVEAHKLTKDSLEKARRDVKKKNVLSLEMEDYERSMKELSFKMEENKKKIVQMESTIDTQEGTIASMKVQINLLEEQIRTEKTQNGLIREELQTAMDECREKDNVIQAKNKIILKLEQELEDEKRRSEESNLEVTSLLSEKEKIINCLAQDKTELKNKMKRIKFKCTELSDQLSITKIELEDLKVEYANYKVRAQAVLRQNQTVDHSQEERLKEEAAAYKAHIETLTAKLASVQAESAEAAEEAAGARRRASETAGELARALQRSARLHADLARLTQQLDAERAHHQLQVSTLTQCYKTQMAELEMRLHKDMHELRNKLTLAQEILPVTGPSASDDNRNQYVLPVIPKEDSDGEMDINVSMIPREEGEGSASPPLKYQTERGGRSPVPLERLLEQGVPEDEAADGAALALSPDQELLELRRNLDSQQQRVKHVTVLLAESERECARLTQLSELLKAELRRGRPPTGADSAEYMKNVTLKFLTLPPGDERSRLVPVLQKILSLTHEEANIMQAVAKGIDPNHKAWGNYLPWSGGK